MLLLESIPLIAKVGISLLCALLISFAATPAVKSLAHKVGAVDIPKDERRMHKRPIARMGGLAIFLGFIVSVILFFPLTISMRGVLIGGGIILVLGIFDDIYTLPAIPKFLVQIAAALVAVLHGNKILFLSNPNIFSDNPYWVLGYLSIPVTVIWIVAITNAVNLIDGLDGLAVGIATISSLTMLIITMLVSNGVVAVPMAALAGACLGFMPYNLNPAKIFMGDTGSTFLGFILATMSIQGFFKFHAIISFAVPFLLLGLPIFDTCFAILRRISKGQNPMSPDRSHVHHKLIDLGMNQKQAVAILYVISAILGLSAVVLTTSGALKAIILLVSLLVAATIVSKIYLANFRRNETTSDHVDIEEKSGEKDQDENKQ